MNNRFMFNFIYHLSKPTRRTNRGFAIPLAIGLGLAITSLGITMILRSKSDKTKVYNQQQKTESLSAAEIGLNRIKVFLDDNRYLLMYPSKCSNGSQECWSTLLTTSSDTSNLPKIKKESVCSNNDTNTLNKIVEYDMTPGEDSGWFASENNKYYRMLAYRYNGIAGKGGGTGTLYLEGKFGQNDENSKTRLKVEIPLISPPSSLNETFAPGLWVKRGGVEKLNNQLEVSDITDTGGNQKFQSDLVFNDCRFTKFDQYGSSIATKRLTDSTTYKVVNLETLKMPDIPTPSSGAITLENGFLALKGGSKNSVQLPRDTDTVSATGFYEYKVDKIDTKGSTQLIIPAGKKVKIYVSGDISGDIKHDCGSDTTCKPTDVQIFGLAQNTTPNDFSDDPVVDLNGNETLEAFILAPNYTAGVNGGGVFKGSLWVDTWSKNSSSSSNSNQVVIIQTAKWADFPSELLPTVWPQLGNMKSWQEEQIGASIASP